MGQEGEGSVVECWGRGGLRHGQVLPQQAAVLPGGVCNAVDNAAVDEDLQHVP